MAAPDGPSSWHGFLQNIVNTIHHDDTFTKFSNLKSNEERIQFCWDHNFISNSDLVKLYSGLVNREKDSGKSEKFRKLGNHYFGKKHNSLALETYTKSILESPEGSECLALAYANRSAVLYDEKLYEHCLKDTGRALAAACYPEAFQHKLHYRRAQCFEALGQYNQAKEECVKASLAVEEAAMQSEAETVWKEKISRVIASLDSLSISKEDSDQKEDTTAKPNLPEVLKSPSDKVHGASSVVVLGSTEDMGRGLEVSEDVEPGSVLFVEKPFASVLLPDFIDQRCQHCYRKNFLAIPCETCNQVRFCSPECKATGWDTYHRLECLHLDFFSAVGVAHLAFRTVIIAGLEQVLEVAKSASCAVPNGITDNNKSTQNSYEDIFNLVSHEDEIHPEDQIFYALTAMVMLQFLKLDTDFFPSDTPECDYVTVGAALLRHMQQVMCNANAITELLTVPDRDMKAGAGDKPTEDTVFVRVATALYPSCSLLNHACEPNILTTYVGDRIIVRATLSIKKGQQIFNCYGPMYARHPTDRRQEMLKGQYFFTCKCSWCTDDSSVREGRLRALKCQKCSGPILMPASPRQVHDLMRSLAFDPSGSCEQTG